MALDQSIRALQLLAPIAGTIPVGGEQLKAALEATTKLCEFAKVGRHLRLLAQTYIYFLSLFTGHS
jgi:hypothetical protein